MAADAHDLQNRIEALEATVNQLLKMLNERAEQEDELRGQIMQTTLINRRQSAANSILFSQAVGRLGMVIGVAEGRPITRAILKEQVDSLQAEIHPEFAEAAKLPMHNIRIFWTGEDDGLV
ncbi:hypothetical protein [Jiella mangrovi]|uniref:Uncharacterized protein n=1 Tax=Jiella mangrovi TaxID=2821407 RepID=A0ABS4BCP8_9HYPH|nr:hypothetical protein [Jiella mangrovi]MBP0614523.1 hypothetical protein [Jiella mangrovi]